MTVVSLTIDEPLYQRLHRHLFPGDHDEHGAVLIAGIAESARGKRLLVRDVFLAQDGVDYVPGVRGYRALTARFVAEKATTCADQNLCYLAVHCHGGADAVAFSSIDLASHERGYPALLDITKGGPVGGLVFAESAVAGDIWTRDERFSLSQVTVVGNRVRKLYPALPARPRHADPIYDRHGRLFGDLGQEVLGGLKVGIIGLGGGGSLLNEWLARLGVGHIVAVDPQRIDSTNLPRVVGATRRDALVWLMQSRYPWLRSLARRFATHKVTIARGVAKQANPSIRYDAIVGDVRDEQTAHFLCDVDFLFLATDNIQSRLVFNALIHQYLIPGVQIGVKVRSTKATGQVDQITVATRTVLPSTRYGCLLCHNLIPPARIQQESLTDEERRAQRYIDDEAVAEPSVITLNALSAAPAVNDFMMMFTGLYHESVELDHQIHFAQDRITRPFQPHPDPTCRHCSTSTASIRARGDRARLPCRKPV